jgi:hypothetical protein
VADVLAILIARAKDLGQVGSLIPHLVDGGVSILQYADDTILFMEHDTKKAINMKLILCMFEQLSGLKINFHKSDFFVSVRLKRLNMNTWSFLVARQEFYLLGIWVYQSTIENLEIRNGILWNVVLLLS